MVRDRAGLSRSLRVGAVRSAFGIPLVVLISACGSHRDVTIVPGGVAARGESEFTRYGCGSCHTIDGWGKPKGKVGPPLSGIAERTMIAGELPNTPDNMIRWIKDPQSVEPATAMPNLGVSEDVARDLTAYLYSLR